MSEASENNILVICPCLNEEGSIGALIDEIRKSEEAYDILVIDDGSTDSTYKVASAKANTIKLPINLGIGGAVQTGYQYAFRHNYQYAVQIDGDGQHDPSSIKPMIEAMKTAGANLAIGTRYKEKKGFQSSMMRRLGARIISQLILRCFSFHVSDPTSGLRLVDKKLIKIFSENYPVDYPEPLSLCFALRRGFKVIEVPVHMRQRSAGTSSIGGLKPVVYMIIMVVRILSERIAKI